MNEVGVVRVGELLRGLVGYLGKDKRGNAGCLGGCGSGGFGEDGTVVGYAGIEERC